MQSRHDSVMKTARPGTKNRTRNSDDESQSLTFAALEQRIEAMPDGPSAVLNTPAWLTPFQIVGALEKKGSENISV